MFEVGLYLPLLLDCPQDATSLERAAGPPPLPEVRDTFIYPVQQLQERG